MKIFTKILLSMTLMLSATQIILSKEIPAEDSIQIYLQLYQYEKALDICNVNLKKKPDNTIVLSLKSQALKGLFKYTEAINIQEILLAKDSLNTQPITEMAYLYKALGDFQKAQQYFLKANLKDTSSIALKLELANTYYMLEDFENAIKIYQPVYAKDSTNVFLIKNLARSYDGNKQNDQAKILYKKLLNININDPNSVLRLSKILQMEKNYSEGIEITEGFRNLDSNNPKINRQNAFFYMMKKNYKTASTRFKECYEKYTDTTMYTLHYLGVCYFKQDSFEQAKNYLELAYARDSSNISNIQFLAQACTESYYKALGVYYSKKVIELSTPAPEYMATIYKNLWVACKGYSNCPCETRLEASKKVWQNDKKDTLMLYDIATAYDCINDKENAIKAYKEFIKTRPRNTNSEKPQNVPKGMYFSIYDIAEERLKEIKGLKPE